MKKTKQKNPNKVRYGKLRQGGRAEEDEEKKDIRYDEGQKSRKSQGSRRCLFYKRKFCLLHLVKATNRKTRKRKERERDREWREEERRGGEGDEEECEGAGERQRGEEEDEEEEEGREQSGREEGGG